MSSVPPPSPYPQVHATPTGAVAWFLGLVVLVCLPFVGSLLAGLLMVILGLAQRGKGSLAARNGTRAANWGLTYVLATVILVGTHFYLLWSQASDGTDTPLTEDFFPLGIPVALWAVLTLVHVVMSIWGGAVALQGKPFRGNGIPFIRATR